jgi:pimeloyl-ACP methyl ester carboxylesterase
MSFGTMSSLIQAAVSELGTAVLVGHSMGGALALHATRRSVDVKGAVLVGSVFPPPFRRFNPRFLQGVLPPLAERLFSHSKIDAADDMLQRLRYGTYDCSLVDPAIVDRFCRMAEQRAGSRQAREALTRSARTLLVHLCSVTGMTADIVAVRKPVLVLHGAHDHWVSPVSARAALVIRPRWEGRILAACGHIPPLEKPAELAGDVYDWYLRKISPKTPSAAGWARQL